MDKKEKKKNKSKKILLILGITISIVCVAFLTSKMGTNFEEVEVSNNNSPYYSKILLQQIPEGDRILLSDFTLNNTLALLYSEGNENVKNELNSYFKISEEELIGNYNQIYNRYKNAYKRVIYANSLWYSKKNDISKSTKNTAKKMHMELKKVDINHAANKINRWVKKKTNGKIKNAVNQGDLSNEQSVILSTLYFNEKWKEEYEDSDIKNDIFHGKSKESNVTFLSSEEHIFLEDDTAIGFMRPYKDDGLYFVGVKPKQGYTINDIEADRILNSRRTTKVSVKIPEFEYEYDVNLNDILNKLGINNIFVPGNLNNITSNYYITKMIQKNYIKVNRKGTEAFSVNLTIGDIWASIDENEVYLDEPFIFMIYDETINQVLFIGNVNNL